MKQLMTLPRYKTVVNFTFRRLLSVSTHEPSASIGRHHQKSFYETCGDTEMLSKIPVTGSRTSLQIIKATPRQPLSGSIVKHIYKYPSRDHQSPDKNKYLSNWKSLLNNTYEGLLGCNVRPLANLKQIVVPQGQRGFHTTSRVSLRPLPLIPYEPPKDLQGLTYISDFGEKDTERMQKIAYYELKNLLTSNKIQFTKQRFKRLTSDNGLFGTSLEALVHKDIKRNRLLSDMKVPTVFSLMVRHIEDKGLETEGIFRVVGNERKVHALREDLASNFYRNNEYPYYKFDKPDLKIHDVAATLKAFLDEMPISLVTSNRLEIFPAISGLPFEKQIEATNLFIISMPEEYRDTLQVFLRIINAIMTKKNINKMDDVNLAVCLTPSIFEMPRPNSSESDILEQQFGYFRIMANYNKKLFVVPPKLLRYLRKQYDDGDIARPKRKFKSKGKKEKLTTDDAKLLMETEIEVHAPNRDIDFAVVRINTTTTAQQIVDVYHEDLRSRFRSKVAERVKRDEDRAIDYLFEVGGNIGERCIDPDTRVMEVFRANPAAEWVIKTKKGR